GIVQATRAVRQPTRRAAGFDARDLAVEPGPEARLGLGPDRQLGAGRGEAPVQLDAVLGRREERLGAARPELLFEAREALGRVAEVVGKAPLAADLVTELAHGGGELLGAGDRRDQVDRGPGREDPAVGEAGRADAGAAREARTGEPVGSERRGQLG